MGIPKEPSSIMLSKKTLLASTSNNSLFGTNSHLPNKTGANGASQQTLTASQSPYLFVQNQRDEPQQSRTTRNSVAELE